MGIQPQWQTRGLAPADLLALLGPSVPSLPCIPSINGVPIALSTSAFTGTLSTTDTASAVRSTSVEAMSRKV